MNIHIASALTVLAGLLATPGIAQTPTSKALTPEFPAQPSSSARITAPGPNYRAASKQIVEVAPDHALPLPLGVRGSWPQEIPMERELTDNPVEQGKVRPLSTSLWDRVYYDHNADGVWSMGESYKALSHGEGFTYYPFLGSKAPQLYPVTFRLESVTLGETELQLDTTAKLDLVGDRVVLDRGPVKVWYDMSIQSVEQSFALNAAGGSADLVLNIAVETELERQTLADGLSYRNSLGGLDYTKAFVVDATGYKISLAIVPTQGGLSLTVPASYLAQAVDPIVVDPLFSTYQVQPGLARDQQAPDVAFDLSRNVFAYVNSSTFAVGDQDVYIETFDAGLDTQAAAAWTDFTIADWFNPVVANDNTSNTFLVACSKKDAGGRKEVVGATHEAFDLLRSPQFQIGNTADAWDNHSLDVAGNSVGTSVFKVVWARNFESQGYTRIRSTTVTPTSPHSTAIAPIVGALEAVTNSPGYSDSQPAISQSSGKASNAEWQLVFVQEDLTWGDETINNVRYADDNTRLSSPAVIAVITSAEVRGVDVSAGLSDLTGTIFGGSVYCLTVSLYDGVYWSIRCMPLERNTINNPFALWTRENRAESQIEAFPAIASLNDRFLISYVGSNTLGGSLQCQVSTLDYTTYGGFGVNERSVFVGTIGNNTPRSGGAASRFSGGLYTSRYCGIAHRQTNATIDVRAVRFSADTPSNPAIQYCLGTQNSTGDQGYITMYGTGATTGAKTLLATSLPTGQFGYFVVGHNAFGQFIPPGSAGPLCVTGGIFGRYNQAGEFGNTGGTGQLTLSIDPTAIRGSNGDVVGQSGAAYNFQAWHRENGGSSNFSNAIMLRFD
ncbi:MAG: hypothetical protein ACI87O_001030 [Planctomycetota bacterium]|jgi:hypothetical protein